MGAKTVNRKKILMVAPTPFFADRGCHTRILNIMDGLQKIGHEILLCTYGLGRNIDGFKIVRTLNYPWYKKLSAGPSITKIFLLPLLFFTTLKHIKKFKPDIVHAFLHEGTVIAKLCSFFYRGTVYIFDCQGSLSGEVLQHGFVKENGVLHRIFVFLEKRVCRWFPVITQSENLRNQLIVIGRVKECINVMDSVNTDVFFKRAMDLQLAERLKIDTDRPTILYMGLLEKYQGADLMFEAFAIIKGVIPNAQFIVIGFPNIEKYGQMCKKLGIHENVLFLGKIEYFSLPSYLSLSSIAVAPKIAATEGDGKIYNYMAMGMAIATFDRDISKEILGDDEAYPTALFAKMADANDLAQKLIYLLQNPDYANFIGENARKRAVQALSHLTGAEKIEGFYDQLVKH